MRRMAGWLRESIGRSRASRSAGSCSTTCSTDPSSKPHTSPLISRVSRATTTMAPLKAAPMKAGMVKRFRA